MFVGNQHETPILQEGYPKHKRDRTGRWTREYYYKVNRSTVYLHVPSVGAEDDYDYSGDGIHEDTRMVINSVDITERLPGTEANIVGLRLVFAQPEASSSGNPKEPGVEIIETNTEIAEKPITEHPNWAALTDDQKKRLERYHKTFTHGRIVLTHTKSYDRKRYKLTEDRIKEGINDLLDPPGIEGPTEDAWMKTRRSIRMENGTVEHIDEYQFDQNTWDGHIRYDTVLTDILPDLPEE